MPERRDRSEIPTAEGSHVRAWLYALLAVLLVLTLEQVVESFARRSELVQERSEVLHHLAAVRARLEGAISANLFLVHGLTAVIASRPDIDQAGFANVAKSLMDERHALRNIGGAPNMVVSMIYPLEGNEAAIGLDYRSSPTQREAALRARDRGKAVIAGPLVLRQGGVGVIARDPVFLPPGRPGGQPRFWGLVSAVIDVETLYRQAGLRDSELGLEIALRGTDGTGARGPVFFGDGRLFDDDPVTVDVTLPGGSWQMAAVPANGWGRPGTNVILIRLMGLLAALAAGTMAYRMTRDAQTVASYGARLRLFIEHAPAALAMLDRELRYMAVSRRWLTDYRLEGGNILGRSHYEVFPEVPEHWRAINNRALAGEVVRADEDRFERADGSVQWLRWEVRPWHAADGDIGGIVIFTEDITAHKEAEARAREGELVLDSVFQALPDLFFLMDADGTIRDYRARHDSSLYVPPERFLGRRMAEVLPADVGSLFARKIAEIGEQGSLATFEYDLLLPGGVRRFEARLTHLPDRTRLIAVVRDITREHQDRLLLAASEARYRQLFEQNPAPMLVYERGSLRMLAVNDAFTGHYGYSRSEALALRLTDLYAEAERQPIVDLAAQLTGLAYVGEWHHLKKDGSLITIEARSHDMDYEGRSARIAVITDITERKRLEDEIQQLNAELEERVRQRTAELAAANKELETFTYSVSHDLKAPLRGIDGYSRLLLEDHQAALDEEGRLFLHNIRHGTEQMSQLIEDLLAYSRMERRTLSDQKVDLAPLVARVLDERRADIQARGMVVATEGLAGLAARGDPEGLAIALRNLVDNALKFSRDSRPPTLTIRGTAGEKSTILEIRDNGIGFDMQFHDRIFDIFQRLQRAEDFPGTGVGLAIVRKAMQRMGGRAWAESAPGCGAAFHLELPR